MNIKEGKTINIKQDFIEKACAWLKDHHSDFPHTEWGAQRISEEFRKAMEE